MAKEVVDDGEFWLPTEFLTDDELLTDFGAKWRAGYSTGFGSCFGVNSDLNSPVESVTGSVETESDEDEIVFGITQGMRKASLQSFNGFVSSDYPAKGGKMYGSPPSTLCGCDSGGNWACRNCRFPVAPSLGEEKTGLNWDMLYAAAEELARLRRMEEEKNASFHSSKLFPLANRCRTNSAAAFYPYRYRTEAQLAVLQLRAAQFRRMKQEQQQLLMRRAAGVWGQGTGPPDFPFRTDGKNRALAGRLPETWPTLQQSTQQRQPHHHQPMVYLGDAAALKKERNGTGVFLPRRFETRNKPAPNPDKVSHCPSIINPEYDRRSTAAPVKMEVRLPQDWPY
ncbi:hypothetical protein M569_04210 [Genlisea aurea]|uniref:Uncharacterized protein n=1 Tax=Genlisea aurea TaxID=192259 RepID=S8CTF5_9LAMI|nr:hypothetical protein M569_04210 [Genlisea aurea]